MNIVVKSAGGQIITRPDTSWNRKGEDFFVPDFVSGLHYSPVVYTRLTKPGKYIGEAFTSRYFSEAGYGILLYASDFIDSSPWSIAAASCLDYSSFLPQQMFEKGLPELRDNDFIVHKADSQLFSGHTDISMAINKALQDSSRIMYLRSGDIIAVEMQNPSPLMRREEGNINIRGAFGGIPLFDFNVIVE